MPADEPVLLDIADGVAWLTLNRPDAGNAVSLALVESLHEAVLGCAADRTVRAVLLAGAGPRFCVGGDLAEFSKTGDGLAGHLRKVTTFLHAAISGLARLDAPVVAAVQGSAAGAGMSLACACDVVVAAESSKFVMAYTRIGLSPDGSGTWFLPRLVGWRRAGELMLTNRTLTAAEARDWGIVTTVVPDGEVAGAASALANDLAAGPTRAFGSVKRLLRLSATESLETQLQHETDEIATNAAGHDGSEGMKAFLEKRPPTYEGS